ncbi:PilZ domain-containing protein [Duganella caerulea]|uniref:PilZ domain-containing protein n=1 Tax=Duganella caerulea TaxID=2885762 RepID=UPI0040382735
MDPRREHVRRLLQVDAHISDMDGQNTAVTQIIDISRMGVAFLSDHAMPLDTSYVMTFSFPGSPVQNKVTLTVLHSALIGTHGRYRNGARFLTIPDEAADLIVDYVTSAPAN